MIERNGWNNCELFVTCSGPYLRNERNTPLGGVTFVRGVGVVRMLRFRFGIDPRVCLMTNREQRSKNGRYPSKTRTSTTKTI